MAAWAMPTPMIASKRRRLIEVPGLAPIAASTGRTGISEGVPRSAHTVEAELVEDVSDQLARERALRVPCWVPTRTRTRPRQGCRLRCRKSRHRGITRGS